MEKLFYVETKNNHQQVLFFTSYESAFEFLQKATTWNKEKIEKSIILTHKTYDKYFNFFPKQ
jgi:hypothetical protein